MINNANYKILVVDDDPGICELLARWLRREEFLCETAGSAGEALELLKGDSFELLLTDINMPEMTGLELQKAVGQQYPELAVIVVTAVEDIETAVYALENGAYGFITKPFHRMEVIINVTNALRLRELEAKYKRRIAELEQQLRECTGGP